MNMEKLKVFGYIALLTSGLISILYIMLGLPKLGTYVIFGLLYGYVLQRGRLCFATAFRDLYSYKNTRMAKGIVLGLIVEIIGFSTLISLGLAGVKLRETGLHTLIGGVIFGFGMAIAGGCASGTLFKMGQGNVQLWMAFFGTLAGMASLAYMWDSLWMNYIKYQPKTWLPNLMTFFGSIAVSLAVLITVGIFLFRAERNRFKIDLIKGAFNEIRKINPSSFLTSAWPAWFGFAILGLLNIAQLALIGKP